jgi:hypothetical protein
MGLPLDVSPSLIGSCAFAPTLCHMYISDLEGKPATTAAASAGVTAVGVWRNTGLIIDMNTLR